MTRPYDFSDLSAAERLMLAQQLLDSVLAETAPLTPPQLAEMRRRRNALESERSHGKRFEFSCSKLALDSLSLHLDQELG